MTPTFSIMRSYCESRSVASFLWALCLVLFLFGFTRIPDDPVRPETFGTGTDTRLFQSISVRRPILSSDGVDIFPLLPDDGDDTLSPSRLNSLKIDEGDSICVIVRTCPTQKRLLLSQLSAWEHSAESAHRGVNIFVVNTDPTEYANARFIVDAAIAVSPRKASFYLAAVDESAAPKDGLYGYDLTQILLDMILKSRRPNCEFVLFTNGDNYYHKNILKETQLEESGAPPAQMIGFDFVCHHERPNTKPEIEGEAMHNVAISAEFEYSYIDLGAAFIHRSAFEMCPTANFHPKETAAKNFALDWWFFEELVRCNVSKIIVRQVLFIHQ